MMKLGRNYILIIDPKDGLPPIILTPPLTLQFWVNRNTFGSLNDISIDVLNLSKPHRRRIFQDRFDLQENIVNDQPQGRRSVELKIGYETLYTVFKGDIFSASSSRSGTEIVTRIEGLTGIYDIAAAQSNLTVEAGQTLADIFKTLIGQFPTLKLGAVGNFDVVLNRPVVLDGSTWALLKRYAGAQAHIDNGNVYVLNNDEVIKSEITRIDPSTGLLGTPRREQGMLNITTLMEPNVRIDQLIALFSTVEPIYNGLYKVIGLQHQGVISGAVSGDCRSTFTLLAPNFFTYKEVQAAA